MRWLKRGVSLTAWGVWVWLGVGPGSTKSAFVVGALTHLWELRDLPIPRHSLQDSRA
jgi:hypothetical protein